MLNKLTESNLSECKEKFNLSYHVDFAHWCEKLVGFSNKDVLECGGSLPREFVFDYLNAKSWTAVESPEYENSLKGVSNISQASILPNLSEYDKLDFTHKLNIHEKYNFYAANIEELPHEYYNKYDLIFSIAAFEHIHNFPTALEKMFLALKPGGQLFSVFSPIWSSHDGHHLPLIQDVNQGRSFDFHNSPIPAWGHLLMRPPELCRYLYQFTDKVTVDLMMYHVYNSGHINRFFTEDYIDFINQSLFAVKKIDLIGLHSIPEKIQQQLEILYPGRKNFANNGILVILEKPDNQSDTLSVSANQTNIHNAKVQKQSQKLLNPKFSSTKPRIDVVLQATGRHGWSFSQGWVNVLQKQGLLNRVFTPIAAWGAQEPHYDDGLFEYLKNPQADIILMPGFDWHSQPLHQTIKWQERWHQAQIGKIALLQECYSAEVVQNTPVWQSQMHQALRNTLPCVDALICNHEPDVDFLKKQLEVSLPTIFLPFYVDLEYFKNQKPFPDRLNRALFRGNAPRHFTENTYKERHRLIEVLSQCQHVDLFSNKLYEDKKTFDIMQEYVYELNSYTILLNLPSIAPTFTVRPFEIMACGGLLLQNKIIGEQSNALFKDWEHLVYYDADNPNDLINKIQYLIDHPDITQKIAQQGQLLCTQLHTNECRLNTIIEWKNNKYQSFTFLHDSQVDKNLNESERKNVPIQIDFVPEKQILKYDLKIIVDGVFFQLYKTGIARVWKSLLEEWSNKEFSQHIIVLDRAGTAPKISGIRYRSVPSYDYNNGHTDREMLQQVCDEEGADLFISSYYTTPTTTPSVFMAYDMIPEVMGWNLNNPMWQVKQQGIQHASAYIAISEHTARDLVNYYDNIPLESVTVAHCGVKNTFSPISTENVNAFKTKYGITKPYFILVGGGSGYKNGILFFRAFSQLINSYGFDIVLTGSGGVLEPEFRACTSGSVVHMVQLSDEELATAYSGAVALVYPSKYEGFGMPVVEAMACGCPVITCPNASIPEVAGEAAIYINDDDVDELANALCDVQKPGVRKTLIAAGLAQAKKFSWSNMAEIVSSALINTTLLSLNLKEINLIIFPDWSQSEEIIGLELQAVIKAVATHIDSEKITLLISTSEISDEEAELLLSSVAMNLLMEEDLDISDGLEISLLGNLSDIQWSALLPRIQTRIILEHENQDAIIQAKADTLTSYELDSLNPVKDEQFFFA